MTRPRTSLPRLRAQAFQRHAVGDEILRAEIEAHTASGGVAIVRRWRGPSCTVVKNETLWLVRPDPLDDVKGPVGSYPSVALALAAADRWATTPPEDGSSDFLPRGGA